MKNSIALCKTLVIDIIPLFFKILLPFINLDEAGFLMGDDIGSGCFDFCLGAALHC